MSEIVDGVRIGSSKQFSVQEGFATGLQELLSRGGDDVRRRLRYIRPDDVVGRRFDSGVDVTKGRAVIGPGGEVLLRSVR